MIILVVDDDAEDLELFRAAVEDIDHRIICVEAYNGMEALKVLQRDLTLPDFIFLDINMPFMNGKHCLSAIKSNKILQHIPVVMFSTSGDPDEIAECKNLGADFLVKPNSIGKLIESLSIILGKKVTTASEKL